MALCETDREIGMEMVSFIDDPETKRVTASVPLLAKATAEYRTDFGCIILNDAQQDAAK